MVDLYRGANFGKLLVQAASRCLVGSSARHYSLCICRRQDRVCISWSSPAMAVSIKTGETEMPYADVNGQHLYYEDTGGAGTAIVFSHGILLDGTVFAAQVAALRDRYRCITWDERGHGKTAGETLAPFSYYESADDLAALLSFLVRSASLPRRPLDDESSYARFLPSRRCSIRQLLIDMTVSRSRRSPERYSPSQRLSVDWAR
jgi:hypothetical protein